MCTVSFKVDENIKEESQKLFEQLGLSFSEALNIYLKACILNGGIPFELKLPSYNEKILERLKEAEDPTNLSPAYKTTKDLIESLNA